jgi:hypothetical protein
VWLSRHTERGQRELNLFLDIFSLCKRAPLSIEPICPDPLCFTLSEIRSLRSETMDVVGDGDHADDAVHNATIDNIDFGFLPDGLVAQCRRLIESYHELHGYSCLPDILWKAGLGPFIQAHREFGQLLKKASTTRSAKKSNDLFAQIATTILSVEILASNFAGWSRVYPQAAARAQPIFRRNTLRPHTPLMDFYLYPSRSISSAAIATLAPPLSLRSVEADLIAS